MLSLVSEQSDNCWECRCGEGKVDGDVESHVTAKTESWDVARVNLRKLGSVCFRVVDIILWKLCLMTLYCHTETRREVRQQRETDQEEIRLVEGGVRLYYGSAEERKQKSNN